MKMKGKTMSISTEETPRSLVDSKIDELKQQITQIQTLIGWIIANRLALESIGITPVYYAGTIDFNYAKRNQIVALIKAFPGKWQKNLNYDGESMDYVRRVEGEPTLRIWAGELPPSCRIVEEWVDVPAQPAGRVLKKVVKCSPSKEKNTNSPGPTCGICGKGMTPENATISPELFLCDDCARSEQVKAWEKEVRDSVDSMRVYPPKETK